MTRESVGGNIDPAFSGYNFQPGADILGITPDTNFFLGMFEHINEPITSGTAITSVDYKLSFDTNGVPMDLMTTLIFDHNETPNNGNPYEATTPGINVNGCADIVTVASAGLSSPIVVNGDNYYFDLLGFSRDGGTTFDLSFESAERGHTRVGLYGIVRSVPVPEPITSLLLGMGLIGLGARRISRNRA